MRNLLPGLRQFNETVFPEHESLFRSLASGQKPHTLMITCSDSRIDPNLLTQTNPGEVFLLRNAGNIVPPFGASRGGEEATIEFAIKGLGITNIVVCGHSHCGAMSALMGKVDLDHLPCVKNWLGHAQATRARIESTRPEYDPIDVAEENVLAQINNLKTHPSVAAALQANKVKIFGWIYHFENGVVSVYDSEYKKFIPSVEVEKDLGRYALC